MADAGAWTIKRCLDWTRDYLAGKGDEHPRLSAEWLLSAATGKTRVELYTNYDEPLEASELAAMHAAIERRAAGEPLQYVTGDMGFRHIVLRCEPGVLIPRPETEVLVDAALEGVDAADGRGTEAPAILEVGCGTGCVALSIASERPGTHVTTTDVSPEAVSLAERNRDALDLADAVDVIECDLASGVDEGLMGTFDVLVSNPPYIPSGVMETLPEEVVGHEPALALDGGTDGLDVFRRLLDLAPEALVPGGMFCCELFEDALEPAAALVREAGGWDLVEVREDLTHRPRVLVCVREA
ncbi:MAG: peptide chain release factor N(5)-glutamine methyltransferase [Atopobiaceae bacterium]|jgi:release factor glutamine methyltransferase|nr:peptide chain release factor N(5)-glutamine methyltransferase [Atopobiaceae bacterium]MCI2173567.1 peptide chain release factor N(5)-glutamine methyltransferase [Atopobiaceae bacterium]MCI2207791.1 peptide chain release factor N(5)-glutamine methyltransferase [Atopobiaceae bacterium]